ncbi:MAG: sigma-70 family RNA polymerase sigma factor [Acidobacteria bacterium]|nr:sigma-70 family RNA polymerase sigma factor [Acidobacteriota bacterium]
MKGAFAEDSGGAHTDLQLARASAAGDGSAFQELYRRHHRRVYCLCLRMLGSATDAEDLTQEIFLQLYRKIATFKGTAAFSTWLHRIAKNTLFMHLRKIHRRPQEEFTEEEEMERTSAAARSHVTRADINLIDLERAVCCLAPGYRAVFVLHDAEGYEHHEIAQMLGIAVGTVKSQLHKARSKLRHLLVRKRPLFAGRLTIPFPSPRRRAADDDRHSVR